MTDKPKTTETEAGEPQPSVAGVAEHVGKTWKGQQFVPDRSVESVQSDADAQRAYDKEGTVSLDVYFAMNGIRNPVAQAGMRAYTNIKRATVEDWVAIFAKF